MRGIISAEPPDSLLLKFLCRNKLNLAAADFFLGSTRGALSISGVFGGGGLGSGGERYPRS